MAELRVFIEDPDHYSWVATVDGAVTAHHVGLRPLPFDEMVERAYGWSQAHGLPVLGKERVWIEGGLQRWLRGLLAAALGEDDG